MDLFRFVSFRLDKEKIVQMLLDNGANTKIRNKAEQLPRDSALNGSTLFDMHFVWNFSCNDWFFNFGLILSNSIGGWNSYRKIAEMIDNYVKPTEEQGIALKNQTNTIEGHTFKP